MIGITGGSKPWTWSTARVLGQTFWGVYVCKSLNWIFSWILVFWVSEWSRVWLGTAAGRLRCGLGRWPAIGALKRLARVPDAAAMAAAAAPKTIASGSHSHSHSYLLQVQKRSVTSHKDMLSTCRIQFLIRWLSKPLSIPFWPLKILSDSLWFFLYCKYREFARIQKNFQGSKTNFPRLFLKINEARFAREDLTF